MKSEWITSTMGDVCSVVTDGAHNSPKSVEKGRYMASVKDFTDFGFDFSNCRQISEEDYERLCKQGCVPKKNEPDIQEISKEIKQGLEIVFVEKMEQVIEVAFVKE